MEAAQEQQTLATTTLDRLREHTAGIDAIVRQEIRATLLEELQALDEDSRKAAEALRRLQRTVNLRLIASIPAVCSRRRSRVVVASVCCAWAASISRPSFKVSSSMRAVTCDHSSSYPSRATESCCSAVGGGAG